MTLRLCPPPPPPSRSLPHLPPLPTQPFPGRAPEGRTRSGRRDHSLSHPSIVPGPVVIRHGSKARGGLFPSQVLVRFSWVQERCVCRRFQVSSNHLSMGDNSTRSLQDFVVIGCLGVCFNLILVDVPFLFVFVFLFLFCLFVCFDLCFRMLIYYFLIFC